MVRASTGTHKRSRGNPGQGVVRAAVEHGNSARRGAGWKHRTTDLGIRSKRREGGFGSMNPGTAAEAAPYHRSDLRPIARSPLVSPFSSSTCRSQRSSGGPYDKKDRKSVV